MATKECPMCGAEMQLKESSETTHTPGNPKPMTHALREWVCPECDYFEEAGEDE